MAKFLYYQDAHLKGINPARRTDNYLESWMIKFREVLSLAKKHKVEKVIDGFNNFILIDSRIILQIGIDKSE